MRHKSTLFISVLLRTKQKPHFHFMLIFVSVWWCVAILRHSTDQKFGKHYSGATIESTKQIYN